MLPLTRIPLARRIPRWSAQMRTAQGMTAEDDPSRPLVGTVGTSGVVCWPIVDAKVGATRPPREDCDVKTLVLRVV